MPAVTPWDGSLPPPSRSLGTSSAHGDDFARLPELLGRVNSGRRGLSSRARQSALSVLVSGPRRAGGFRSDLLSPCWFPDVGPSTKHTSRRVDPVELASGRIDPRPFDRIVVGPILRTPPSR
jgi:hypothetical protein